MIIAYWMDHLVDELARRLSVATNLALYTNFCTAVSCVRLTDADSVRQADAATVPLAKLRKTGAKAMPWALYWGGVTPRSDFFNRAVHEQAARGLQAMVDNWLLGYDRRLGIELEKWGDPDAQPEPTDPFEILEMCAAMSPVFNVIRKNRIRVMITCGGPITSTSVALHIGSGGYVSMAMPQFYEVRPESGTPQMSRLLKWYGAIAGLGLDFYPFLTDDAARWPSAEFKRQMGAHAINNFAIQAQRIDGVDRRPKYFAEYGLSDFFHRESAIPV